MRTHHSKGKTCGPQRLSLDIPPPEPWSLVRAGHKGQQRHPSLKTPGCVLTPPGRLHFFIKLSTIYMGFVVVRKTLYGPVGFFHGERFGIEFTMEIAEFASGDHRQRWQHWLHVHLPGSAHSKTCERGKWNTVLAKTWLEPNTLCTAYESSFVLWKVGGSLLWGMGMAVLGKASGGCPRYLVICSGNLYVLRQAQRKRKEKLLQANLCPAADSHVLSSRRADVTYIPSYNVPFKVLSILPLTVKKSRPTDCPRESCRNPLPAQYLLLNSPSAIITVGAHAGWLFPGEMKSLAERREAQLGDWGNSRKKASGCPWESVYRGWLRS